jgi:hypothetical protein
MSFVDSEYRTWKRFGKEDGFPIISWVSYSADPVMLNIYPDVYYEYLEQQVLNSDPRVQQAVLLVRASVAYLIRHSQGLTSISCN